MSRVIVILGSCLFLQSCVPYFTTHWPEDDPQFAKDSADCRTEVIQESGRYSENEFEDCLLAKGWAKKREWDLLIIPVGGSAGM